jgi:predicted metalloprotease
VVPDSFTHGWAQQRMQWFSRGMQSGDMRQCNTFGS